MSAAATGSRSYSQLSDKVLQFAAILQRLVAEAKHETTVGPDFWAPLAVFIAVDEFERVASNYSALVPGDENGSAGYDASPFARDALRWPEYIEVMSQWALSPSLWEYTVQRIAELPGLVYLELEERSRNSQGGNVEVANTLSVYEFNDDGKIQRLRLAVADFSLKPWPICSSSSGVTSSP
jgi:hypothetical protein